MIGSHFVPPESHILEGLGLSPRIVDCIPSSILFCFFDYPSHRHMPPQDAMVASSEDDVPQSQDKDSSSTTGIMVKEASTSTMISFTQDQPTAEEEVHMATILKALTEEEISQMPNDHMPLRHLRAEKGDVSLAITKLKAALEWRKGFQVDTIVKACSGNEKNEMTPIIEKENETSKLYVRGYDKEGRALLYMRPSKENTNDMVNNMRHLVWNLEKAIACSSKEGRSKVCIVIDYDGFSLRHAPSLSASRYSLDILQKHYPERMHKAYICNPPFVFRSFWAVVKPFLDPVTKSKIVFCHGKKGLEQIANDVGPVNVGNLEPCAGGMNTDLPVVSSSTYLGLPFNQAYGES